MDTELVSQSASTVCSIADHMQQLRQRAQAFHETFETGDRGYFTPSEDEQVLALWVSYHKTRNALLDLIDSIRREIGKPSEDCFEEFTIAYASAIVLVDAARFLRELFGSDPIVRGKLNEANTPYGIEAGSFDAVQMSLTDPANALEIQRANQFFEENEENIVELAAATPQLKRVVNVIEELQGRVQVRTRRYVRVRVQDRRHQLQSAIVGGGLLRAMYAVQEWGSRLISSMSTMPGHVPQIPDGVASQILPLLQVGDVFVTRKESAVTNYFLPGYWPHVAMYIGDEKVIESLKDGVRERTLESPLGNDATTIIRPNLSSDLIDQAISRGRTHLGKPYDFDFDFTRSDRLVCTEVVYRSYEGIGGFRFPLTRRTGRETLSAEDLLNMALLGDQFSCVAGYCPKYAKEFIDGDETPSMLRETLAEPVC